MDNILSIKKDLAKRVRELRKKKGWSQQKLAAMSGVSFGSIKRFERLGEISLSSLLQITSILDCLTSFVDSFHKAFVSEIPAEILQASNPILFNNKKIRKTLADGDWWYCLTDIITVLVGSKRPRHYLLDIRHRDHNISLLWPQITKLLPLGTTHGERELLCINATGFFRLVQSMQSKQVEHWRLWLAQVAYMHFQKTEERILAEELEKLTLPRWQ